MSQPSRKPGQAIPESAPPSAPRVGLWVGGITVALTGLLVHTGLTTGDWRGVLVSEIQILVVAAVTYLGLRTAS